MEGNVVRGKILTIGKFYKWRSQTKKVTIMEWGEQDIHLVLGGESYE